MAKDLYRRSSGGMWFLALAVVLFALYSMVIASTTRDDCDGYESKTWQVMPPHWQCNRQRGFG